MPRGKEVDVGTEILPLTGDTTGMGCRLSGSFVAVISVLPVIQVQFREAPGAIRARTAT